jgi:hypothetical protein
MSRRMTRRDEVSRVWKETTGLFRPAQFDIITQPHQPMAELARIGVKNESPKGVRGRRCLGFPHRGIPPLQPGSRGSRRRTFRERTVVEEVQPILPVERMGSL